jgi:SAM-dependent methyltransferase
MIKNAYALLRARGVGGVLQEVRQRTFPERLEYFPQCKSLLQSKVGLEVGGPSSVFGRRGYVPVYPIAERIDNCNFGSRTVWEGNISEGETFVFDPAKAPGRQYVTEASDLRGIPDAAYDFLLSSHCIEHLANPIQGLKEWIRVLKQEGLLVLLVPHKDGTFDHRRPVTSFEHLLQDYDAGTTEHDLTHLEEILELHDLSQDPGAGTFEEFRERSQRNFENRCLHQHVFDTRLALRLVDHMRLQILAVELFRPCHIVVIAKKTAPGLAVDNRKFAPVDAADWKSPFPSDRIGRPA